MGLWDGGEAAAAERTWEAAPIVLVGARDVPDGLMPTGATRAVAKLLTAGCVVRSTYAVALVPGVLRKIGDERQRVTVTRESIAVRFASPEHGGRGWLTWERDDGADWAIKSRWIHQAGRAASFALSRSARMALDAYTLEEAIADLREGGCSAPERAEVASLWPPLAPGRANLELMPWLRDRWAATRTTTREIYPCRCGEPAWQPGRYCGVPSGKGPSCPCWGRPDALGFMPAGCCARRQLR